MSFLILETCGYKNLYDDYENIELFQLIEDIPTVNIIEILAWFQAQIHADDHGENLQIKLAKIWMTRLPQKDKIGIEAYIEKTKTKANSRFSIVNNYAALLLIQEALLKDNHLERLDNLTEQQELNLFKAFLICNQRWLDKQQNNFDESSIDNAEQLIIKLLPAQLPIQEINTSKYFVLQYIKAIYFFKFCQNNAQFSVYLGTFLEKYGVDSWKDYLIKIFEFYHRKMVPMEVPSIIDIPTDRPELLDFIEELGIDSGNFPVNDDFLGIREKPIYKINDTMFCFMNLNFFVDKFYKGIQFQFAKLLCEQKAKYNGNIIKSPLQFIGIFGEIFAESGLFYKAIEDCFNKSSYTMYSGQTMKEIIGEGEPDYYIRDKKKVYIFEYKNVTLGWRTKHSYDWDKVKEGIYNKMVKDNNGKNEGVLQLIQHIIKLRKGVFKSFDDYDTEDAIIYPIIVYSDSNFGLSGVNYMLNQVFREQLEKEGISSSKIQNVVLINIDDLIFFQDEFREKKIKLNHLLKEYIKHTKRKNYNVNLYSEVESFEFYVRNLMKSKSLFKPVPKNYHKEIRRIIEG